MPAAKTTLAEQVTLLHCPAASDVRGALEMLKEEHTSWGGVSRAIKLNHVTLRNLRRRHWPESLSAEGVAQP